MALSTFFFNCEYWSSDYAIFPARYYYKIGHMLPDGKIVWGKFYSFKAPPFPGQKSLQRVVIFGDMGKVKYTPAQNVSIVLVLSPSKIITPSGQKYLSFGTRFS